MAVPLRKCNSKHRICYHCLQCRQHRLGICRKPCNSSKKPGLRGQLANSSHSHDSSENPTLSMGSNSSATCRLAPPLATINQTMGRGYQTTVVRERSANGPFPWLIGLIRRRVKFQINRASSTAQKCWETERISPPSQSLSRSTKLIWIARSRGWETLLSQPNTH